MSSVPGRFELIWLAEATGRRAEPSEAAQKSWRRLDGHNQLPKVVLGVTFNDRIEVIAKPTDRQPITAAA
jgi:hypothetical protein